MRPRVFGAAADFADLVATRSAVTDDFAREDLAPDDRAAELFDARLLVAGRSAAGRVGAELLGPARLDAARLDATAVRAELSGAACFAAGRFLVAAAPRAVVPLRAATGFGVLPAAPARVLPADGSTPV